MALKSETLRHAKGWVYSAACCVGQARKALIDAELACGDLYQILFDADKQLTNFNSQIQNAINYEEYKETHPQ